MTGLPEIVPPAIAWTVTGEELARVFLHASPLARVIPDGCRVSVNVFYDVRTCYDHSRPVHKRNVSESFRVAIVSLVDAEGNRGKEGAAVRFAGTAGSGSCYARVDERVGYVNGSGARRSLYWGCASTTAWRLDSLAVDLPPGAASAMRDTFASAAAFVGEFLPHMWAGSEVKRADRRFVDAEAEFVKARAEVKAARADARKATRFYGKALAESRSDAPSLASPGAGSVYAE